MIKDLVRCGCIEGLIWHQCPECKGAGCDVCQSQGELPAQCPECKGTSQVTRAYAKLRAVVKRRLALVKAEAEGEVVRFPGVYFQEKSGNTDDSLHIYWELREELRKGGTEVKVVSS